uniref:Peptidase M14 domain-containing protein n=4 Tax=Clastoptera arizonana TaxID=38151 RepID=A0A1B6E479_9HEMI
MYTKFWCELQTDQKLKSDSIDNEPIAPQHSHHFSMYDRDNYFSIPPTITRLPNNERHSNTSNQWQASIDNRSMYNLSAVDSLTPGKSRRSVYCEVASSVRSIIPFVKVAYPDMVASESPTVLEPLNNKERKTCRAKMIACVERGLKSESNMANVVYDLDTLLANKRVEKTGKLINNDEERLRLKESGYRLCFESRFESGNLRKVIQIGSREYDLILTPDVNSREHCTWFYFEVSNMDANLPYVFNIINCEKSNSQFNFGMKPLLYSVKEAVLGNPGWVREGSDICYFRNPYPSSSKNQKKRTYLTATFTIKFPHNYDICYLAYHYPYTYSQLLTHIWCWKQSLMSNIVFRAESLCLSLNKNEIPVLTITAPDSYNNLITDREVIFLTARVHPGESNSSWIMHGTLQYLLEDSLAAANARMKYVFKVVPMLNPEGVINGCNRCGLTNEDLNRRWSQPSADLHPSIYHTKGLLDYCVRVLKKVPYVFCDFHGHSRRKNVFLYGCSSQESWLEVDRDKVEEPLDFLMLPNIMSSLTTGFALPLCKFSFERHKETTARVTVWREFGVKRSYTMECSYCGCDVGPNKGFHLNTTHLKGIGNNFGVAISCLYEETQWRLKIIEANQVIDRDHIPTNKELSNLEEQDCSDSEDSSDDNY